MFKFRFAVVLIGQVLVMALLVGLPSLAQSDPPPEYLDTTEPENTLASYFMPSIFRTIHAPMPIGNIRQMVLHWKSLRRVSAIPKRFALTSCCRVKVGSPPGPPTAMGQGPGAADSDWYLQDAAIVEVEDMNAAEVYLAGQDCRDLINWTYHVCA